MRKVFEKVFQKTEGRNDAASTSSRGDSVTMVGSRAPTPPPMYTEASMIVEQREIAHEPVLSLPTNGKEAAIEPVPSPSPPQPVETFVRLCPHETLSYERMQRILVLPGFKQSYEGIDALRGTTIGHTRRPPTFTHVCHPRHDSDDSVTGYVQLHWVENVTRAAYGLGSPGLEMRSFWYLDLFSRNSEGLVTRMEIREEVGGLGIWLCPHRWMDDEWIVDRMYLIMYPEELFVDPIDEWLAQKGIGGGVETFRQDCGCCGAVFEVEGSAYRPTVSVTRFLGKGESAEDPVWLGRCDMSGDLADRDS